MQDLILLASMGSKSCPRMVRLLLKEWSRRCQGWLGRGSQLCPGSRRNNGTNAVGWGSGASYFPYLIDPLTGIQSAVKAYGTGTVDSFLDDDALEDPDNQDIINRLAQISDASLVFVQARSGEDSDRASLKLEANGDQLINMVASQSNNTILVPFSFDISL